MTHKQSLILSLGVVGLGVAGVAWYLTSSSTSKKGIEKEESTPEITSAYGQWFAGVGNLTIGVDNLEEGENLETKLNDWQELEPTEACFSFEGATYSEGDSEKKLQKGKFEFAAIRTEEDKTTKGVLVKAELKESKDLEGIVVYLSKSTGESPSWIIGKGFGFSISNFDKALTFNSLTNDRGIFKLHIHGDSTIFDLVKGIDSEYKPLFGVGLKEENELKITKVYSDSNWKKVKDSESSNLKGQIKNAVKDDTKGTWDPQSYS